MDARIANKLINMVWKAYTTSRLSRCAALARTHLEFFGRPLSWQTALALLVDAQFSPLAAWCKSSRGATPESLRIRELLQTRQVMRPCSGESSEGALKGKRCACSQTLLPSPKYTALWLLPIVFATCMPYCGLSVAVYEAILKVFCKLLAFSSMLVGNFGGSGLRHARYPDMCRYSPTWRDLCAGAMIRRVAAPRPRSHGVVCFQKQFAAQNHALSSRDSGPSQHARCRQPDGADHWALGWAARARSTSPTHRDSKPCSMYQSIVFLRPTSHEVFSVHPSAASFLSQM